MLGFSVYLNQDLDLKMKNYIKEMKIKGFSGIFTSLHIPEENILNFKKRIFDLAKLAKKLNLELTVDVDEKSLNNIGYSLGKVNKLSEIGITELRIDDGIGNKDIANLSNNICVGLNASTITNEDLKELKKYKANFIKIKAWHNYYPRPETGLDINWYKEKNLFLKRNGFNIVGFVPGDQLLREPLRMGLPTLENHRNKSPFISAIELFQDTYTDNIYIGDPLLSTEQMEKFNRYFNYNILSIDVDMKSNYPKILNSIVHSRKDLSRDVIRIEEGRFNIHDEILPTNTVNRYKGSITLDNYKYKRYMGEIQITKNDLLSDEKVNVIGHVKKTNENLINYIYAGQKIKLNIVEED